jgi:hypothetical protein
MITKPKPSAKSFFDLRVDLLLDPVESFFMFIFRGVFVDKCSSQVCMCTIFLSEFLQGFVLGLRVDLQIYGFLAPIHLTECSRYLVID